MATRAYHIAATGTYTVSMGHLHRVVVNTGATSATLTIRTATADDSIAVIDASAADIGRVYDLNFTNRTTLEFVLAGGAADITILYD